MKIVFNKPILRTEQPLASPPVARPQMGSVNEMKKKKRKRIWVLSVGLVILTVLAYHYSPVLAGAAQARSDIRNGGPRYLIYGELLEHDVNQKSILTNRYGIKIDRVAGCVVSDRELRKWGAYNEVIKEHFRKTRGIDNVFMLASEEAIHETAPEKNEYR